MSERVFPSNNPKVMKSADQRPDAHLRGSGCTVNRTAGGPVPKSRRTSASVAKRGIRPGKGGGRVR